MKISIGSAVAALLFLSTMPASAQKTGLSGNDLYNGCKNFAEDGNNVDLYNQGVCARVVSTVFYYGRILGEDRRFCRPEGSNIGQAVRILVAYMASHPAILHERMNVLAVNSLREAWPCKD